MTWGGATHRGPWERSPGLRDADTGIQVSERELLKMPPALGGLGAIQAPGAAAAGSERKAGSAFTRQELQVTRSKCSWNMSAAGGPKAAHLGVSTFLLRAQHM